MSCCPGTKPTTLYVQDCQSTKSTPSSHQPSIVFVGIFLRVLFFMFPGGLASKAQMFSSHIHIPPSTLPCTILTVFTVLTLFTIFAIYPPRVPPPLTPPAPPPLPSSLSSSLPSNTMGGTIPRHVKARSNNKKKEKKERKDKEREMVQNPQVRSICT